MDPKNDNLSHRIEELENENEKLRELLIVLYHERNKNNESMEYKDKDTNDDQLDERIRSLPIEWLSNALMNDIDISTLSPCNKDFVDNKGGSHEDSEEF